jgi:hypothetical protein|tara:strand:- start:302 stop:508 length:207 start_codon:yes stop_codon:yes gene_type:complete
MPLRPNFTKAPEESPAEVDVFGGWLAGKTGWLQGSRKGTGELEGKDWGLPGLGFRSSIFSIFSDGSDG